MSSQRRTQYSVTPRQREQYGGVDLVLAGDPVNIKHHPVRLCHRFDWLQDKREFQEMSRA
jgi:hypothetical protein